MKKFFILSSSIIAVSLFITNINDSFAASYKKKSLLLSQINFIKSFFPPKQFPDGMNVNSNVQSSKHSLKSAISGFSYGLGLAADFEKYNTELKLSYSLSKAKLHNAELIYSLNSNYKLGAYLTYGLGENRMQVKNALGNIDVQNKQRLVSGMISAYYQFAPLCFISAKVGLGLGIAKHTMKLNTTNLGNNNKDKSYGYKDNYTSFAYGVFLGGISNINKFTAIELSYNISSFGFKKRSVQLKNAADLIELQKTNINHNLTLGIRVLL